MKNKLSIEERFWLKVQKTKTCWNWIAGTNGQGYGRFRINNKKIGAHKFSWELHNKVLPKWKNHFVSICVLHKCDNRLCVNPDHLFLGSHQDNMNDMYSKNRHPPLKGEAAGNSKLTEKEVLEIRKLYSKGNISQRKLAKQFNVTQPMIKCITKRQNWKHI